MFLYKTPADTKRIDLLWPWGAFFLAKTLQVVRNNDNSAELLDYADICNFSLSQLWQRSLFHFHRRRRIRFFIPILFLFLYTDDCLLFFAILYKEEQRISQKWRPKRTRTQRLTVPLQKILPSPCIIGNSDEWIELHNLRDLFSNHFSIKWCNFSIPAKPFAIFSQSRRSDFLANSRLLYSFHRCNYLDWETFPSPSLSGFVHSSSHCVPQRRLRSNAMCSTYFLVVAPFFPREIMPGFLVFHATCSKI